MIYTIFNWLENLAFTWSKKSLKTFQKCRFKMFSYKKEKKEERLKNWLSLFATQQSLKVRWTPAKRQGIWVK